MTATNRIASLDELGQYIEWRCGEIATQLRALRPIEEVEREILEGQRRELRSLLDVIEGTEHGP